MDNSKLTHEVVVHKAGLTLASGESLSAFTRALSESGQKHVMQKLNLTQKSGRAYMIEAFATTAVFDVYKYDNSTGGSSEFRYYATKYERKDTGDFDFGPLVEVQRVTSFQPKNQNLVQKAKKDEEADEPPDDEDEEGESKKKKKTKKDAPLGWEPAAKSLWHGVL